MVKASLYFFCLFVFCIHISSIPSCGYETLTKGVTWPQFTPPNNMNTACYLLASRLREGWPEPVRWGMLERDAPASLNHTLIFIDVHCVFVFGKRDCEARHPDLYMYLFFLYSPFSCKKFTTSDGTEIDKAKAVLPSPFTLAHPSHPTRLTPG